MKKCTLSIEAQTYTNFEVWIVDGGSIDGSKEFIETLPKPFNTISEKDKGIYDAMNKGIVNAKGDWLLFLGADDFLFSEDVLASIFENSIKPNVDILLSKVKYELTNGSSLYLKRNNGVFLPKWSNLLWIKNTVNHQGVIYRKKLFKNNLYNLDYKILSDYHFNLKLYNKGVNYRVTNSILAVCGSKGISKLYNWSLYKEELNLKVKLSSIVLKPLFFVIVLLKYLLKKVF